VTGRVCKTVDVPVDSTVEVFVPWTTVTSVCETVPVFVFVINAVAVLTIVVGFGKTRVEVVVNVLNTTVSP
jgi:acyl-CoA synthetase (NDP forming)